MRSSAVLRWATLVAGAVLLLPACGGDDGGDDGDRAGDGGGDGGPVELTFWAWAPGIEQVVDLWNQQNPDIQVTVNQQDAGDALVTKVVTAIRAGSGAPDLMQAEYQALPTLVASDALADISGALGDDVAGEFPDGIWSQVTLGGDAVYAVPQDSGPMMFYYREDVFAELGIEVPTTWDEYADAARAVRAARPDAYLGTFSSGDPGWFAGLTQQAGASWWGIDGDAWSVAVDDEPARRVAEYWGGLVEEGVIDNKPMYTPEWNTALNDGTQVGWVSAIWAPGVLAGNAADTAGLWRMAPLPQWDENDPGTGTWGGSSTAVTSQSEHVEASVEFLTWLNTSEEAVTALVREGGLYPASQTYQETALAEPPEFFAGQPDFYDVAAQVTETVRPFTYGPNVNVAYNTYNDAFATAAEARTAQAFLDALAAIQEATVDDLVDSGFTVAE